MIFSKTSPDDYTHTSLIQPTGVGGGGDLTQKFLLINDYTTINDNQIRPKNNREDQQYNMTVPKVIK